MPFVYDSTVTNRSVTFKYVPTTGDAQSDELRTWTFDNPGTYRDENDPMKHTEMPIEDVEFLMDGGPGRWAIHSITIRCALGDGIDRKIRTQVISRDKYNVVPWWLAKLAASAVQ